MTFVTVHDTNGENQREEQLETVHDICNGLMAHDTREERERTV